MGIVPADGGLVALDVDSPKALGALRAAALLPSGFLEALKAEQLGPEYGLIVATGGTSQPFAFEDVTVPPMHWYVRANGVPPRLEGVVCRHDSGYVVAPGSKGHTLYRLLSRGAPLAFAPAPVTERPETAPATPDSAALRAPDLERVRAAVSFIPNTEDTDREKYVAIAHMIKGAAGDGGRDIFLNWAAKWPGDVDPAEDERVFDTIAKPRLGWDALWRYAARFGFDASPEIAADARNAFEPVGEAPPPTKTAPSVSVRSFADVRPTPIEWLLPGRVAREQITMINGWPGEGKTSVVIDIAARLTRAEPLPDGSVPPRPLRVLFLSTEDSESILHLRLRAAGADMHRVLTIPDTELERLTLPSHQATWVRLLQEHDIDVVVVDPMKAFLDSSLKDIAEQDARKFMQALRQICEATNVAAICIRHPNKATAAGHSTAISAASGSLGFTAAARIELLVGRMPDDEETRALVHVKNNLAKAPPALLYRIVSKDVSFENDGSTTQDVAGIEWKGVDDTVLADELLARRAGREERSKLQEAKDFLKNFLASGPAEHTAVREAARRHGIAARTLERALPQVGWHAIVGNLQASGKSIWGLEEQTPADFKAANDAVPDSKTDGQAKGGKTKRRAKRDGEASSEVPALEPADLSDLEEPNPGAGTDATG